MAMDEKEILLSFLTTQRNHVLGILEDLPDDDLRRPVLPSGWSCVGLMHHLALDVESFWFRAVTAGEHAVIDHLANSGNAWQVSPDIPTQDIVALYRQEIDLANAIIAATPLDTPPAWWPDFFGNFRLHTLREIILHVITETACHAGHADVVRELIDGKRWMVLTE